MSTSTNTDEIKVDLKDPYVAGVLAFVLPGLGHLYQGRIGKAILYFVCIVGSFAIGVGLSSNSTFGGGRAVYISFPSHGNSTRLAYLAQVWVGLPAAPAAVQYLHDPSGEQPLFGGFMAPPVTRKSARHTSGGLVGMGADESVPTADNIRKSMGRYYELGTLFTLVAGLLNIFAIFDAYAGPLPPCEDDEKDSEKSDEKNSEKDAGKDAEKNSKKDGKKNSRKNGSSNSEGQEAAA